jgi:hypothetical protein
VAAVKKPEVRTVVQLLAKAESTDIDAEAMAFVERSYRLLAQILTAHDSEHGRNPSGPRRRERRLLTERRAELRAISPVSKPAWQQSPVLNNYSGVVGPSPGADHVIDLSI